jgi:hypothetical protein
METHRYRISTKNLTILLLVLGAAGFAVFLLLFDRSSPEAAIDFRVDRGEAAKIAESFARQRKAKLGQKTKVTIFTGDRDAMTYMERTVGLPKANRLASDKVTVWTWRTRWFEPLQPSEFEVWVSPAGKVVGFERKVAEDAPGARLSRGDALMTAELFVTGVMKQSLSGWHLATETAIERPKRLDHFFEWKKTGFKIGEADLRISVTVQGKRVGEYKQWLKVPEAWARDFEAENRRGEYTAMAAEILSLGIVAGVIVVFLLALRRREVNPKPYIIVGAVVGIATVVSSLNGYPIDLFGFDTTQELGSYAIDFVRWAIMQGLVLMAAVALIGTAGDAVYRKFLKDKIPLPLLLSGRGLRSREFASAAGIGYAVCFIHLGYVTLFYLFGSKVGVWSPAETTYDNSVATLLPWIYPLTVGLSAAVLEEFMFRFFAISFLRRYLRSNFLAILIPAVIWAFMHCNYPQQPFFIRGLEITLPGLLFGYVMIRYGVLATIVSHYVFNALQGSLLLLRSSSPYLIVSGAIVVALMLIPLIPAVVSLARRRRLIETSEFIEEARAEEAEPSAAAPERPVPTPSQVAWARQRAEARLSTPWLVIVGIVGAVGLATFILVPPKGLGDWARIEMTREDAREVAHTYLRVQGISTEGFSNVTYFVDTLPGYAADYIAETEGVKRANEVLQKDVGMAFWQSRWFRPGHKEEYLLQIKRCGALWSMTHTIPEDQAGPKLGEGEARKIALRYLRQRGDVKLSEWRELPAERVERPNRTDHVFTWEKKGWKIGDARLRMQLAVQGGEPTDFVRYVKLPEKWVRDRERTPTWGAALSAPSPFVALLFCGFAFAYFVGHFIKREIRWKQAAVLGAVMAALTLVLGINSLSTFYAGYNTISPVGLYTGLGAAWLGILVIGVFIGATLLAGFADAAFRRVYPDAKAPLDWFGDLGAGRLTRREIGEAAVVGFSVFLIAAALAIVIMNTGLLTEELGGGKAEHGPEIESLVPSGLDTFAPAVSVVVEGIAGSFWGGLLVVAAAIVVWRLLKRPLRIYLVFLAVMAVIGASFERDAGPYLEGLVFAAVAGPIAYYLLRSLFGLNALKWAMLFYAGALLWPGIALMRQDNIFFVASGWIAIGMAAVPFVVYALFAHGGGYDDRGAVLEPQESDAPGLS